jgi:dATP pyrophosphohydrolase
MAKRHGRRLFAKSRKKPGWNADSSTPPTFVEQFYEADRDAISLLPVFVGFVEPQAIVIINHEHSEYRWVSFEEALTMVPFAGQRHVKAEFVEREPIRHLLIKETP